VFGEKSFSLVMRGVGAMLAVMLTLSGILANVTPLPLSSDDAQTVSTATEAASETESESASETESETESETASESASPLTTDVVIEFQLSEAVADAAAGEAVAEAAAGEAAAEAAADAAAGATAVDAADVVADAAEAAADAAAGEAATGATAAEAAAGEAVAEAAAGATVADAAAGAADPQNSNTSNSDPQNSSTSNLTNEENEDEPTGLKLKTAEDLDDDESAESSLIVKPDSSTSMKLRGNIDSSEQFYVGGSYWTNVAFSQIGGQYFGGIYDYDTWALTGSIYGKPFKGVAECCEP
jgi:hypothetical protein